MLYRVLTQGFPKYDKQAKEWHANLKRHMDVLAYSSSEALKEAKRIGIRHPIIELHPSELYKIRCIEEEEAQRGQRHT